MFKRILIANRGEIAVRVMRACRELGIETVSVYSEADTSACHVRYSDRAYPIGPPPSSESYLCIDTIIEVALRSGAEAIHPGYGFLAENPVFARKVQDCGLVFIGPRPETIELLGDKMAARRTVSGAGVRVVPGVERAIDTLDLAKSLAREMGYPILIKAAAGGGGKGMRIARQEPDLAESLRAAKSEARSAFGDDRIYVEKYLEHPRHIEIQIIADTHGNVVHLGERECSIQRRHQKVVEESPSPIVTSAMREAMGDAAISVARASNYINAGTVEFLVDEDRNFYFLEVNTRLQVEHPVTEMVTGIDLVKEQIGIAAGKKLSFAQKDITWRGSAIECRIYAEDAENNFLPSVGTVTTCREPAGPGIRVDSGLSEGEKVPIYYDPLIAKLLAWGKDRAEAMQRMQRALCEYKISGVKTGIPFHQALLQNKKFLSGHFSTHFIQEEIASELRPKQENADLKRAMAIVASLVDFSNKHTLSAFTHAERSPASGWKMAGRRRNMRDD